jgi:hypothetical protein
MTDGDTRPAKIEGGDGVPLVPWQLDEGSWSFGPTEQRVVGWSQSFHITTALPDSKNTVTTSTAGPQEIEAPKEDPGLLLRRRNFGKRGLEPLYHWEGVVEEVRGPKFRARLVPLQDGRPNAGEAEYTEFLLEDLANESDRHLVVPGAIFYWTIARSKNAAGTMANVSLVRFRRIPPPSWGQQRRAQVEAVELLRQLGGDDRPNDSSR